ncbi:MAG: hypothetical protein KDD48_04670 [Bdellovibrionales bacterium]|nr:hypothetical protein [Bdellovibrionales bacterium]
MKKPLAVFCLIYLLYSNPSSAKPVVPLAVPVPQAAYMTWTILTGIFVSTAATSFYYFANVQAPSITGIEFKHPATRSHLHQLSDYLSRSDKDMALYSRLESIEGMYKNLKEEIEYAHSNGSGVDLSYLIEFQTLVRNTCTSFSAKLSCDGMIYENLENFIAQMPFTYANSFHHDQDTTGTLAQKYTTLVSDEILERCDPMHLFRYFADLGYVVKPPGRRFFSSANSRRTSNMRVSTRTESWEISKDDNTCVIDIIEDIDANGTSSWIFKLRNPNAGNSQMASSGFLHEALRYFYGETTTHPAEREFDDTNCNEMLNDDDPCEKLLEFFKK